MNAGGPRGGPACLFVVERCSGRRVQVALGASGRVLSFAFSLSSRRPRRHSDRSRPLEWIWATLGSAAAGPFVSGRRGVCAVGHTRKSGQATTAGVHVATPQLQETKSRSPVDDVVATHRNTVIWLTRPPAIPDDAGCCCATGAWRPRVAAGDVPPRWSCLGRIKGNPRCTSKWLLSSQRVGANTGSGVLGCFFLLGSAHLAPSQIVNQRGRRSKRTAFSESRSRLRAAAARAS